MSYRTFRSTVEEREARDTWTREERPLVFSELTAALAASEIVPKGPDSGWEITYTRGGLEVRVEVRDTGIKIGYEGKRMPRRKDRSSWVTATAAEVVRHFEYEAQSRDRRSAGEALYQRERGPFLKLIQSWAAGGHPQLNLSQSCGAPVVHVYLNKPTKDWDRGHVLSPTWRPDGLIDLGQVYLNRLTPVEFEIITRVVLRAKQPTVGCTIRVNELGAKRLHCESGKTFIAVATEDDGTVHVKDPASDSHGMVLRREYEVVVREDPS